MPEEKKHLPSNGFSVTVNKDAVSLPLLESNEVSSIEIRDSQNKLMLVVVLVPGHPVMFVSAADKDPDFAQFCANMGFKIQK